MDMLKRRMRQKAAFGKVFDLMKNVLEWLERSAERFPDKTAVADGDISLSYESLCSRAKALGTALCQSGARKRPAAVLLPRCANALAAMFGIVYSGNFYVVLDADMPEERMRAIIEKLDPFAIVTNEEFSPLAERLAPGKTVDCAKAFCFEASETALTPIRRAMTDADPLYTLFTSGSTGTPKGVVVSHRNVLSYIGWFGPAFGIGEEAVFGGQTPLYFSMSVSDVYGALSAGATLELIPRSLFSFPALLIDFLNERRVDTIYWVPSALCLIANWDIFDCKRPEYIRRVLFAGETMPTRHLNYWRSFYPTALFANLFGPTETTDICAYYILDREFRDDEPLPIGHACDNLELLLLREDGTPAAPGEEGELCVRGSFVAPGYYGEPEKTAERFIQSPLNAAFPDPIYCTGDIVRENERGELVYVSRRDGQVKRMGYRIELGEIEAAASAVPALESCAALYDADKKQIILAYCARNLTDAELREKLKSRLPAYMLPERYAKLAALPLSQNGKTDRKALLKALA